MDLDPDPGGQILREKNWEKKFKKISDNCTFIFKNEVNMDQLHGFNIWATILVFLKGNFFYQFCKAG